MRPGCNSSRLVRACALNREDIDSGEEKDAVLPKRSTCARATKKNKKYKEQSGETCSGWKDEERLIYGVAGQ